MSIDLTATDESVVDPPAPAPQPPQNRNLWVLAIVMFVGWYWYQSQPPAPSPTPDDGSVVVVDDDQVKPDPGPNLKGTHLVYVYEATGYPVWIDDVIESQTTESLKAAGFTGWRSYDVDMDEVKSLVDFAASKQIAAPFAALVKDLKTKQPVKIEPMPKTPQALLEFLK